MTLPFRRRHHDDETVHDRARALTSSEMVEPLPAADADWLAQHLDGCAECRQDRAAFLADRELLRGLREAAPEPPRDLWARTAAALEHEARPKRGRSERATDRRGTGWRGLPFGAAAGALIVLVVIGASLVPPIIPPSATPGSTDAGASFGPDPTSLIVTAGRVGWIRAAADGTWELVITEVDEVCPRTRPECQPLGDGDQGRPVNLGGTPTGVTISPSEQQLVVEARGQGAAPDRIFVVPIPPATQPETPAPSSDATPDPGTTDPPTTEAPTDEPLTPSPSPSTPIGAIEIATGVTVVGEAAYSADGRWLAFSARPSDGSTGPDLYLWSADQPTAMAVTDDHATYFSAWFGDRILASRVEAMPDPAASAEPSPSVDPEGSPAAPAGPIEAHPVSFLLDPETLVRQEIAQPDMWLPVVDPTGRFVAFWSGTLRATDGLDWELGTGQLVLTGWSDGPDPAATPEPEASPEPALGPVGDPVVIGPGAAEAFKAKFDPTGTRLAVWVGEQPDAAIGRLHLIVLDPETGDVQVGVTPLPGAPALRRFSIDIGRVAWVSPSGQDGQESAVQVLGWAEDEFGEIRAIPAKGLYIVR